MSAELTVGLVLTGLAYSGLWWAVIHGKRVVEQVKRGEYPHHPNPEHRPDTGSTAKSTASPVPARAPADGGKQILVPIANTASAEPLVRLASTNAVQRDVELLLTSVLTVPEQTPLEAGWR